MRNKYIKQSSRLSIAYHLLKNHRGEKRKDVDVPEKDWKEMLHITHNGIKRKLDLAGRLVDIDKDISAGLYTYALEEFGKIILLDRSISVANNTKRRVMYADSFTNHDKKFTAAFNYLQDNGYEECYVLNNKGDFDPKSFTWQDFNLGLLADFEARMSIFYSDFAYDASQNIVIQNPPVVEANNLKVAINNLEMVVSQYHLPKK